MKEKITAENIEAFMRDAVKDQNEAQIKEIIIRAMELFLKNKDFSKEDLDSVASTYLMVPIHEPDVNDIEFKDTKLRYVLEELSAIETVSDLGAHDVVKRFILYLESKDYEKVDYFQWRREGKVVNKKATENQTLLDRTWAKKKNKK